MALLQASAKAVGQVGDVNVPTLIVSAKPIAKPSSGAVEVVKFSVESEDLWSNLCLQIEHGQVAVSSVLYDTI